jgi:hypothetical protein
VDEARVSGAEVWAGAARVSGVRLRNWTMKMKTWTKISRPKPVTGVGEEDQEMHDKSRSVEEIINTKNVDDIVK